MKDIFFQYLEDIGITTQALIKRIEEMHDFYRKICPEEFEDIFLEDIINKSKERDFVGLSFFSKNYCLSSANFLSEDTFVMVSNHREIIALEIKPKNYDFEEATEFSRMTVDASEVVSGWAGKATGKNCKYLKEIAEKYFVPNIKKS